MAGSAAGGGSFRQAKAVRAYSGVPEPKLNTAASKGSKYIKAALTARIKTGPKRAHNMVKQQGLNQAKQVVAKPGWEVS